MKGRQLSASWGEGEGGKLLRLPSALHRHGSGCELFLFLGLGFFFFVCLKKKISRKCKMKWSLFGLAAQSPHEQTLCNAISAVMGDVLQ